MKDKFSDNTLNRDVLPERNHESTETGKIKLLDVVALTQDVPDHNLKRGEVGTVVEILSNGKAFEVEFSDDDGQMYKCLTFSSSQPHRMSLIIISSVEKSAQSLKSYQTAKRLKWNSAMMTGRCISA